MKKIIYLLIMILSILTFSACGKATANPVAKDVTASIISDFSSDSMTELSADRVNSYYDIDLKKLEDFSIYIEGSGGYADEVAIFKVKDNKDIEDIKASIDDRIKNRLKDFDGYNSEELVKIKNNLVLVKGKYILFVISENNDKAKSTFNAALKWIMEDLW